MFEHVEQIKDRARRINRAMQEGLAGLFLVIGGLLLLVLILQSPDLLKGIFSGNQGASKALLMNGAAIGLCWLQWRYRHVVYPQLRREFLAGRSAR